MVLQCRSCFVAGDYCELDRLDRPVLGTLSLKLLRQNSEFAVTTGDHQMIRTPDSFE